MTDAKNWFEISKSGLAKLIERRGKVWLLYELIANAWDAPDTTRVEVTLSPEEGVPHASIVVTDDSPSGFADLSHSYTLFAESSRKGNANQRGRFNLGEKLVLALCTEASISSTTGGYMFDHRGRTTLRKRRERGSEFSGIARITRSELAEIQEDLRYLISPASITTTINGVELPQRVPLKTIEATLPTETADEDGILRRTSRKCRIAVYAPLPGREATIYEMGIPIVATGDKWDLSISQKVPLSMERDNVTPSYLRAVRTYVVNAMADFLTEADANSTFVNDALSDPNASSEAVTKALDLKYGEKRAVWDPSDPEANMNLVADGYTLIKGAQLTGAQWTNVKKHGAAVASGKLAPTKKALFGPDGEDRWVDSTKWTAAMHSVVDYTAKVTSGLLDRLIAVNILSDVTLGYSACFGDSQFVFNVGRLGKAFFAGCENGPTDALNALIIHECGHGLPGGDNHLSSAYHDGLCTLGARFVKLALERPELFKW